MPNPIEGYSEEENALLMEEYEFMEDLLIRSGPGALWEYLKSVPENTKDNTIMFYVSLAVLLQQRMGLK